MSNLIIHRGTQEIGGSAVEINNKKNRILFDFGIPLDSMDKKQYDLQDYKLPINGLYKDEDPEFDAIFLTHAHPDHYGLMQLINPQIPIYVTKVTCDILTKIAPLVHDENDKDLNLKIIEDDLTFGDIKIKAHNVDHSIAGACAYEIQTEGKTIVYTGDIRFHGRTSWQSSVLKRTIKSPDYLIMEGTTLGRKEQKIVQEKDLEKEFIKIFKGKKLPIVKFSPQNIDRFVTVYRACLQTGKTLVVDPYTCFVLQVYSQLSKSIPQFDWKNIMVNFAQSSTNIKDSKTGEKKCNINEKLAQTKDLFKYKSKKIGIDEIIEHPEKYVIKGNFAIEKQIINRMDKDKINIVFSMWKGYLDKPGRFDYFKDIEVIPLHTSGHAYIEDLQKLVNQMQPKNLIPIHTECKGNYKELFNAEIIELDDGQEFSL